MTTRIGIFLFEEAEELDWAGPWEVLALGTIHPDDDVEVFTVAHDRPSLREGPRVLPDHDLGLRPPDGRPGLSRGKGTRPQLGDEAIGNWVRGLADRRHADDQRVHRLAGVRRRRPARRPPCNDLLGCPRSPRRARPDVEVRPDDRFVDTGDVITAAGVSAGIDMALHLVRAALQRAGAEVSRASSTTPSPRSRRPLLRPRGGELERRRPGRAPPLSSACDRMKAMMASARVIITTRPTVLWMVSRMVTANVATTALDRDQLDTPGDAKPRPGSRATTGRTSGGSSGTGTSGRWSGRRRMPPG